MSKCPECTICAGHCEGEDVFRLCALARTMPEYRAELELRAEAAGGVVRAASLDEAIVHWWAASVAMHEAEIALKEGRPVPAPKKPCCKEKEQAAKPPASGAVTLQPEREQLRAPVAAESVRPSKDRQRDPRPPKVRPPRRQRRY